MSDKETRPDHDVVARWADGRDQLIAQIEALGFDAVATLAGYSVQRDGRQFAVFTIDADALFFWGWVETDGNTGRTDYRRNFDQFLDSLTRRHGGTPA